MSSKFNRWLRSRTGLATVSALLILAVVVGVVLYNGLSGGTPPQQKFDAPDRGYTCMPTCDEKDGRFLVMVGADMASFTNAPVSLFFGVPAQYTQFNIQIFDGDDGMDSTGALSVANGNWDTMSVEPVYTLYADPLENGSTAYKVGEFRGNQLKMPNNGWYTISVPIDKNAVQYAKAPSGNYFYRLEARLDNPNNARGLSGFKIRSDAYVTTGPGDSANNYNPQIGLIALYATVKDRQIVYPNFVSVTNVGTSTYDGSWYFYFQIAKKQSYVSIWDGDFDHGTTAAVEPDTNDPDTIGKPVWAGPGVLDQGAQGKGNPPDDTWWYPQLRNPAVSYTVVNPLGQPIYTNPNPSGNQEWENFEMTTDATQHPNADVIQPDGFLPGQYNFRIDGLDFSNAVFLKGGPICDGASGCGPCPQDDCGNQPKKPNPTPSPYPPLPTPQCTIPDYNLANGYAIVALNPAACQGEQNGLLFHGTSGTYVTGSAYSAGCLRPVGTVTVQMTNGTVDYVGDSFGNMSLINPAPRKIATPLDPSTYQVNAPDCTNPAAHQVDAKDWNKGDIILDPGLYCVSGDVSVNAKQKFLGNNVTIYMMNGSLTINGGALVQLSAPYPATSSLADIAPALPNILFYVPGSAGSGQKVQINGTSDSFVEGVVYAPGSDVAFLGTSYTNAPNRSQIIGWNVEIGGTADLYINYAGTGVPVCTTTP